jgi:hypothetical protein
MNAEIVVLVDCPCMRLQLPNDPCEPRQRAALFAILQP